MAALFLLLITVSVLQASSECPAVLDITSETGCHNSTNNSTYISISCTVSYCGLPIVLLNGKNTFITIESEIVTKTCMNGSGMIVTCDDYLKCPEIPDPSINITVQSQGFIPASKLTSCIYTVACKSSEPNCTQKTEKTLLLKQCDIVPVSKCTISPITAPKPTTVTMVTTFTQFTLPYSEVFTSDYIEPTCDCTSCYDIISTSTVSLIPTSISCNMSSQLTHTTTSIISTTITSTTCSICSSNIPALSPIITTSQSVANAVKAVISILVTLLIGLILVIVVMVVCLCRSRRQQMKYTPTNGQFFKNDQKGGASLTLERLLTKDNSPQPESQDNAKR